MAERNCIEATPTFAPPIRNRFFYGKLMDVRHFEMEQSYFNAKRWLINRLAVGTGVLCGLRVKATDEPGFVIVSPGVALDPYGREIVVTEPQRVDVRQLTDECGIRTGERAQGVVLISICYRECNVEPVPVLVEECETDRRCTAGAVRERFAIAVREYEGPDRERFPCGDIFERAVDPEERRRITCNVLPRDTCAVQGEPCAPLAIVEVGDREVRVNECVVRRVVYSNTQLLELLFCLANRVDECCGGEQRPVITPPVVTGITPANGTILTLPGGTALPGMIEVAFSRWMNRAALNKPVDWLRVWHLTLPVHGQSIIKRLELERTGFECDPPSDGLGGQRVRYYIAKQLDPGIYLVQMHGQGVTDVAHSLALDADFTGTCLSSDTLNKIWGGQDGSIGISIKDAGGALPASGDGAAGGTFHSLFTVEARGQ